MMRRRGVGKRILIVEDEVRIALSLRRALEHPLSGGHSVEISPNANAALVRLKHEKFDMLITDLKMPGMNGLELIQRAREVAPDVHTILITAFGSSDIERQALGLSAIFVRKPFNLPEFIRNVQEMLERDPRLLVLPGEDLETTGAFPSSEDDVSTSQERE